MLIKLGDKVSTDDISPSGTAVLMFRSNVPAISEFCFRNVDPDFVARARAAGGGVIVGGEIYGQGSSREAAVLSPLHLGVRAVLAKSFARIHRSNLINWGIAPLEFENPADDDAIERDDVLDFESLRESLAAGSRRRGDQPAHRGALPDALDPEPARARHAAGRRPAHPDRRLHPPHPPLPLRGRGRSSSPLPRGERAG